MRQQKPLKNLLFPEEQNQRLYIVGLVLFIFVVPMKLKGLLDQNELGLGPITGVHTGNRQKFVFYRLDY